MDGDRLAHLVDEKQAGPEVVTPLRGGVAGLRAGAAPRSVPPETVYRIKVSLLGATPPIWRRLEVAADIFLGGLHEVIQRAFDWDGGHLHVFRTPRGDFGVPYSDMGFADQDTATLADVAPGVGGKIGYHYDFGDCWDHEIVVEEVMAPCTAALRPSGR
ncbi:plasmid pRiA4b ORF-3 family protein [Actinokineospora auranticolor]|uniref:PRiA4b ORF-3-like protein n=1 Tax=Actinokineospora auranticolor TaxID=155976 RepID=A0A2S6GWM8_9PSEU|nr:plasmid pRiA4b ORF-3 family protein [Actinokineospora auranticolor]PPK69619.1 pRiA4b ORF-3-like protein [Actinokineospora auranticolor]